MPDRAWTYCHYRTDFRERRLMRELALFSGAGGGILASVILGWRTVCAVELDTYASSVLVARQNDGILPPFPIWSDILSFDGHPWRGAVDIVSGGFPCQDISAAGKGEGLSGGRSSLWFEMLRVIKEVRPSFVFIENSPMLARRGLGTVLEGLAQAGYDAAWTVLGADDVEAPHIRKRMWILAQAQDCRCNQFLPHADNERPGRRERESEGSPPQVGEMADSAGERHQETDLLSRDAGETKRPSGGAAGTDCPEPAGKVWSDWWKVEPGLGRVADGVAHRVERIRALGNGQVPLVAATAFCLLFRRLTGLPFDTSARVCSSTF